MRHAVTSVPIRRSSARVRVVLPVPIFARDQCEPAATVDGVFKLGQRLAVLVGLEKEPGIGRVLERGYG